MNHLVDETVINSWREGILPVDGLPSPIGPRYVLGAPSAAEMGGTHSCVSCTSDFTIDDGVGA